MTRVFTNLFLRQVPALVRDQDGETVTCTNEITIMQELARSVYLQDVLFGKKDTKQRAEINGFIETANKTAVKDLVDHLNKHLEMRMFLVGQNITCADIVVHLRVAAHFRDLSSTEKKELPHVFRWIDHIQHLPGMLEQVESLNIFVAFPSELEEKFTKAQLKKMAKAEYQKKEKEASKTGGAPEESKGADKKPQGEKKPQVQEGQAEKPKKEKKQQAPPKNQKVVGPVIPALSQLDFRVGKIVDCEKNPESDKIYMEKIDVGNGEIREISSGLQIHYKLEEMKGAMVVVICNLKARKVAGYMSAGMVMCAQDAEGKVVEFLIPPEGSVPGDLVSFEGYERTPVAELPSKKNAWEACSPGFVTDDKMVGCFADEDGKKIPFTTPRGVCTAKKTKNGIIK